MSRLYLATFRQLFAVLKLSHCTEPQVNIFPCRCMSFLTLNCASLREKKRTLSPLHVIFLLWRPRFCNVSYIFIVNGKICHYHIVFYFYTYTYILTSWTYVPCMDVQCNCSRLYYCIFPSGVCKVRVMPVSEICSCICQCMCPSYGRYTYRFYKCDIF